MQMIPSTGLWAKLFNDDEGARFYPIVGIVMIEPTIISSVKLGELAFRGIMAIGKEMYEADKDEQFVGYATDEERAAQLAYDAEYPHVSDHQVSS